MPALRVLLSRAISPAAAAFVMLAGGVTAGAAPAPAQQPTPAAAPALAVAQQAAPNAPVYNVEVIVFRALGALGTAENWATQTQEVTAPGDEDTAAAVADTGTARLVASVPATDFKLAEIESRLRASGGYQPIAHAAWQQTASPWGTKLGFPLDKLGIAAAGLSGSIALERGQYLHLNFDLDYAPASAPAGLSAGPGTVFLLNETRRVKFFERNYFDHPAFGVIAIVTPVQTRPGR